MHYTCHYIGDTCSFQVVPLGSQKVTFIAGFEASRYALSYGAVHGSGDVSIELLNAFFFSLSFSFSFLRNLVAMQKLSIIL